MPKSIIGVDLRQSGVRDPMSAQWDDVLVLWLEVRHLVLPQMLDHVMKAGY